MKVIASLAVLALAAPALAQTPPPPPAPTSSVTRDLNSGPPAPATYLPPPTTAPATTRPAASPAVTTPTPPRPTVAPATTPPRPAASAPPAPAAPHPTTAAPATTPPHSAASSPSTSRPAAGPPVAAAVRPTVPAPAAAVPAVAASMTEAAPPPPSYTVLDAPARAALPFTLDLPAGFALDAERSGPDFKMYAVRRNGAPFVMIYAGPSSQFPIYDGELVQAAGRSSMVVTEDGQRHAMEHLFQRTASPQEIHIWVASLEGADRILAERIAQSVDVP